jgi:hypothetical protein
MFHENNNNRYRENKTLNNNEVLVRKVADVEGNDDGWCIDDGKRENEVIRYKVAPMRIISMKELITMVRKDLVV